MNTIFLFLINAIAWAVIKSCVDKNQVLEELIHSLNSRFSSKAYESSDVTVEILYRNTVLIYW